MQIPEKFMTLRTEIPFDEVSFGCGGLHLYRPNEVEEGQLGYSVAPDGSSLCTAEPGAWKREWIVIGYDTGLGEPIIMDTSRPELPILTDMHGKGEWSPRAVATSLDAFLACMSEFQVLAQGRSNPVERDENPVSAAEQQQFLGKIAALNSGVIALDFWGGLLEYYGDLGN